LTSGIRVYFIDYIKYSYNPVNFIWEFPQFDEIPFMTLKKRINLHINIKGQPCQTVLLSLYKFLLPGHIRYYSFKIFHRFYRPCSNYPEHFP